MSREKSSKKSKGRLTWRRLLGGLLAACLALLLAIAIRQGAVQTLLLDLLPEGTLPTPAVGQAGLSLHMIDVGQAQAILLTCGGKTALVDTGLSDTANDLVWYLLRQGVRKLDYLFITHPHSDHCGGAKTLLEKLGAQVLIIPEYLSQEAALSTAGDWIGKSDTPIAITCAGTQYPLGEAVMEVIHPAAGNGIEDMNELSLVLKVSYQGRSMLLTGDITQAAEETLPGLGHIDVLQVPHHGSYTSSSQRFLEDITPAYALISCGVNNDYGHPHDSVLSRLEEIGAAVYRTDHHGTLVVRVVEGQIAIKTENNP